MKRDIQLINIKKHSEKYFDFSTGQMFAFMGKNKSGKSTIIQALETIAMVDNKMADPVKKGQGEGKVIRHGVTRDGRPITIEWDVDAEGNNSFRAVVQNTDGEAKVVNNPAFIRELIGTYFDIDASEVFSMMKYKEGRTTFINRYLYACLTEEQRTRVVEIDMKISDKKNKSTENNLYHQRTELNRRIDQMKSAIKAYELIESEKKEVANLQSYRNTLVKIKEDLKGVEQVEEQLSALNRKSMAITGVMTSISTYLEEFSSFEKEEYDAVPAMEWFAETLDEVNKEIELYNGKKHEFARVLERKEKGISLITAAEQYEKKQKDYQEKLLKMNSEIKAEEEISKFIADLRAERIKIFEMSALPGGLSFEDDTITLNGFVFDETTLSDSEARIAIVELLCAISTADFVNIGDWSLYDTDSKKKLMQIARDHDRMIFGQMVNDNNDVECETIIIE